MEYCLVTYNNDRRNDITPGGQAASHDPKWWLTTLQFYSFGTQFP